MFVRANNIRVGMIIEFEGKPCKVMSMTHITPGKGNAVVQTKLRNMKTGIQTENRFRATEDVKRVVLESQEMEFLYSDGEDYYFMGTSDYEQITIKADLLGDDALLLVPNIKVQVQTYANEVMGVELPKIVDLIVKDCAPFIKGATATNQPKPATLETGLVITVPGFISPGEKIRVDTAEKKYLERAKD